MTILLSSVALPSVLGVLALSAPVNYVPYRTTTRQNRPFLVLYASRFEMASLGAPLTSCRTIFKHFSLSFRWFYLAALGLGAPLRSPLEEGLINVHCSEPHKYLKATNAAHRYVLMSLSRVAVRIISLLLPHEGWRSLHMHAVLTAITRFFGSSIFTSDNVRFIQYNTIVGTNVGL